MRDTRQARYSLGPLSPVDAVLLASLEKDAWIEWRKGKHYLVSERMPSPRTLAYAKVLSSEARLREGSVERDPASLLQGVLGEAVRCPNPTCITNQPRERARTRFKLVDLSRGGAVLQCMYCGTMITGGKLRSLLLEELAKHA